MGRTPAPSASITVHYKGTSEGRQGGKGWVCASKVQRCHNSSIAVYSASPSDDIICGRLVHALTQNGKNRTNNELSRKGGPDKPQFIAPDAVKPCRHGEFLATVGIAHLYHLDESKATTTFAAHNRVQTTPKHLQISAYTLMECPDSKNRQTTEAKCNTLVDETDSQSVESPQKAKTKIDINRAPQHQQSKTKCRPQAHCSNARNPHCVSNIRRWRFAGASSVAIDRSKCLL